MTQPQSETREALAGRLYEANRRAAGRWDSTPWADVWEHYSKTRDEWLAVADEALASQPPAPEAREPAFALENCRLYAARHRREEWAEVILRFCRAGGATGSPLRAAPEAQREPTAFWLIERGPNQGQSPHCWWLAPKDRKGDRFGEGFDWTFTAIEATRYPSQKAAEAAAQAGYVTHYAVTSHSLIAPEAATLCPNGEPWDPNPDGIVPGQERGPRMDPHTGFWEESALSETPKWKTFDDYAKAQGIDAGRSRDEYAEVWKEARL